MTTTDRESNYLATQLQRDPLEQAEEILAARGAFLGQPQAADSLEPILQRFDRQDLAQVVDDVRSEFWDLPSDELAQRIDKLDAAQFPDLEIALKRMREVAKLRGEFTRLRRHRSYDEAFDLIFRQIVLASPGEAARLKEAALGSPPDRHRLRRFKKSIRLVLSESPPLYALQSDWFHYLAHMKARHKRETSAVLLIRTPMDRSLGCGIIILLLIALRVLAFWLNK